MDVGSIKKEEEGEARERERIKHRNPCLSQKIIYYMYYIYYYNVCVSRTQFGVEGMELGGELWAGEEGEEWKL